MKKIILTVIALATLTFYSCDKTKTQPQNSIVSNSQETDSGTFQRPMNGQSMIIAPCGSEVIFSNLNMVDGELVMIKNKGTEKVDVKIYSQDGSVSTMIIESNSNGAYQGSQIDAIEVLNDCLNEPAEIEFIKDEIQLVTDIIITQEFINEALNNSDVQAGMANLENQGFQYREDHTLLCLFSSGAYTLNLGFQEGDGSNPEHLERTTHILYSNIFGVEDVGHLDAMITSQGSLNILKTGSVVGGSLIDVDGDVSRFWKCLAIGTGGGCGTSAFVCAFSNSGYLGCLAIGCGGSAIGSGIGCAIDHFF